MCIRDRHGLFRVRAFTQDDAHIYCRLDQVQDEVRGVLELTERMYDRFGFDDVRLNLSTRPEKAIGDDAIWDAAEDALRAALAGREYELNEGDGAFYGPKIDFKVTDTMGRSWQLGTCQLDFALPERFNLHYTSAEDTAERPVMIHRAIVGSIERFLGILIEDTGGDFPLWLAPVQVRVLPIADRHAESAEEVRAGLVAAGFRAEVDARSESVGKRIRDGELAKVPYLLVLGDKEVESGTLSPRRRGEGDLGAMSREELIERLAAEVAG